MTDQLNTLLQFYAGGLVLAGAVTFIVADVEDVADAIGFTVFWPIALTLLGIRVCVKLTKDMWREI